MSGRLGKHLVTVLVLAIGIIVILAGVQPIFSPQLVITTPIVTQVVTRTWFVGRTMTVTVSQARVANKTITGLTILTSTQAIMVTTSYTVTRNFTMSTSVGVQGDYYHMLAIIPLAAAGGLSLGYLLWVRRRHAPSPSGATLSQTAKPTLSIPEGAESRVLCSSCGKPTRVGNSFCTKCGSRLQPS